MIDVTDQQSRDNGNNDVSVTSQSVQTLDECLQLMDRLTNRLIESE